MPDLLIFLSRAIVSPSVETGVVADTDDASIGAVLGQPILIGIGV